MQTTEKSLSKDVLFLSTQKQVLCCIVSNTRLCGAKNQNKWFFFLFLFFNITLQLEQANWGVMSLMGF